MSEYSDLWSNRNSGNKPELSAAAKSGTAAISTASVYNRTHARIEFYGIASNRTAIFLPLDVEYNESLQSEWNHTSVYGRNDPLSTFQGTKRTISLAFSVTCDGLETAKQNMSEISNLMSLAYPTYSSSNLGYRQGQQSLGWNNNASTIEASPLFRVHFNNLIMDPSSAPAVDQGFAGSARKYGLVCSTSGFQITPNFENGVLTTGQGWIYPKSYRISTELTVFHTMPMGFQVDHSKMGFEGNTSASFDRSNGNPGFGKFPYGIKIAEQYKNKDKVKKKGSRQNPAEKRKRAIRRAQAAAAATKGDASKVPKRVDSIVGE